MVAYWATDILLSKCMNIYICKELLLFTFVQTPARNNKLVFFYISQHIFTPPLYEILNLTSEKYGTYFC